MTIVEKGMKLDVQDVKSHQVEKLHFRFRGFGWMNVFLDDMGKHGTYNAGELAIHSDWGSWAYTWTGIPEHETLRQFLCTAGNDYLARKLLGGQDVEEWDSEATKEALRKYINEECPEEGYERRTFSGHTKTVLKKALLEFLEGCDWDNGLTLWVERMDSDLCDFLNGEPWEHVVHKPTTTYLVLTEGLLPALKDYLKEQEAKPKLESVP
jgi:hypothetical protein